ncbi:glycosyltransferase family 2 protein [Thalassotalea montiporae]
MIEQALSFLFNLTLPQLFSYFWPFFMLDMVRYVIIEGIVLAIYLPKRRKSAGQYEQARKQLFFDKPRVSVIVPGKNEGKHLPELVKSLSQQSYSNIELIVVDDGSDDMTPVICRGLEKQGKIDIFIRNDVRGGKASAANTALQFASGQYIVHLDADTHMADNAIEHMLIPFLMDQTIGCVGGDVRVANHADSLITQTQALEYTKSLMLGRTVSSQLGILRIVSGAFGAFRKDVLMQIHGWDVGPGLDGDITLKIRKLGYRVAHEPASVCYTNVPSTMTKLAKQRYRWDKSIIRFRLRKHLDILKPSKEFSWSNFISVADNLVFNLLLDLKWFFYFFQVIQLTPLYIMFILIINYILYALANLVQWLFSIRLQRSLNQKVDYKGLLFVPLMPIYTGFYLRFIRTFSYVMEFIHKRSYADAWNPWKVSKVAKRNKL